MSRKKYNLAIFDDEEEVHHKDSDCIDEKNSHFESDAVNRPRVRDDLEDEGYLICECVTENE